MKIGILTLLLSSNYGGILQAYALQTVLERMGHDVEVFQRPPSVYDNIQHKKWEMPLVFCKRAISKLLFNNKIQILHEKSVFDGEKIYGINTHHFIKDQINTKYINNLAKVNVKDYDAIIVGSDQIWRKPYFYANWQTNINNAFLEFTSGYNIKRISYAASFGIDNLNEYSAKDILRCRKSINLFDAISVREDTGIEICKNSLGIKAVQVLDPTMLLCREDYLQLIDNYTKGKDDKRGDLLCYILDKDECKTNLINHLSESYGLTPFEVNALNPTQWKNGETYVQPPVEMWLKGFKDANFVITDSFHACVFSIIFNKPFIAIGNAGRGMTRFKSLLALFNQQHRLIIPNSYNNNNISHIFNNENVFNPMNLEHKLKELRVMSIDFLNSNLNS